MAIPYIPQDIIKKYFKDYVNSERQPASFDAGVFYTVVATILERKKDGERIWQFDSYMSYPCYAAYWEPFHNFIVYVRRQQLAP
jgi:hypothetical protein